MTAFDYMPIHLDSPELKSIKSSSLARIKTTEKEKGHPPRLMNRGQASPIHIRVQTGV